MERKARNAGGYTARAAEARGTRDPAKPLQFCPLQRTCSNSRIAAQKNL